MNGTLAYAVAFVSLAFSAQVVRADSSGVVSLRRRRYEMEEGGQAHGAAVENGVITSRPIYDGPIHHEAVATKSEFQSKKNFASVHARGLFSLGIGYGDYGYGGYGGYGSYGNYGYGGYGYPSLYSYGGNSPYDCGYCGYSSYSPYYGGGTYGYGGYGGYSPWDNSSSYGYYGGYSPWDYSGYGYGYGGYGGYYGDYGYGYSPGFSLSIGW